MNNELDSKLNAIQMHLQRKIDKCSALTISRAIDHISEGNIMRGIQLLKDLRSNLLDDADVKHE